MTTTYRSRAFLRFEAFDGAFTNPSSWFGRLWRLLAAGALLAVLGGCLSEVSYSGDTSHLPSQAADAQVGVRAKATSFATSLDNEVFSVYIVLRNTQDPSKVMAYHTSLRVQDVRRASFVNSVVFSPYVGTLAGSAIAANVTASAAVSPV